MFSLKKILAAVGQNLEYMKYNLNYVHKFWYTLLKMELTASPLEWGWLVIYF